jgi:hypothetical protein
MQPPIERPGDEPSTYPQCSCWSASWWPLVVRWGCVPSEGGGSADRPRDRCRIDSDPRVVGGHCYGSVADPAACRKVSSLIKIGDWIRTSAWASLTPGSPTCWPSPAGTTRPDRPRRVVGRCPLRPRARGDRWWRLLRRRQRRGQTTTRRSSGWPTSRPQPDLSTEGAAPVDGYRSRGAGGTQE